MSDAEMHKIRYKLTDLLILPFYCSGNTFGLDQRSYSTLAQLAPGWMTIFGWVNHLDALNEYPVKAGGENKHIA